MQHTRRYAPLAGLATLAALGLAAPVVHAQQNLVSDGDFEQADPLANPGDEDTYFNLFDPFDASWTIDTGYAGIDTAGPDNPYVITGDKSLFLNPTSDPTTVSQTLATTNGQEYLLSFDTFDATAIPGTTLPDTLTAHFGGTVLSLTPGPGPGSPQHYSYIVTADSPFTSLSFTGVPASVGAYGGIELDNISVTAAPEPPQPAALGLGILSLGALAAFKARKRPRLSA